MMCISCTIESYSTVQYDRIHNKKLGCRRYVSARFTALQYATIQHAMSAFATDLSLRFAPLHCIERCDMMRSIRYIDCSDPSSVGEHRGFCMILQFTAEAITVRTTAVILCFFGHCNTIRYDTSLHRIAAHHITTHRIIALN